MSNDTQDSENQNWRTPNGDGTYTLHTIGKGDVEIESDYVAHVGDHPDAVSWEDAVSNAPEEGGVLHVHGGTWNRSIPKLGEDTTIIGHDEPTFQPGSQWGGGPVAGGWLVVDGVKTKNTTLWSKGDPDPEGLFINDSEMDGHNQGAIFTSQGLGLLEVHDTEIYDGGMGNVRHNVYSHADVTVGDNVYSHSANGSHAWKVVSDKQILKDSYITNVTKETVEKFQPLSRGIAEYFRYGTTKYDGKRPDQEGGPTGDWAVKPDWTMDDWRALYSDYRNLSYEQNVGTTPVDMISAADSWVEDTDIGFLRVPNTWQNGYAESGDYAMQFRHRRTEIGGSDKPGWWEPEFDDKETWEIGDVTDPQNSDLLQHFIGPNVDFHTESGPKAYQVTELTNRGTEAIDRGGSGGTREGVIEMDMPSFWKEKSRVFAANDIEDAWGNQTPKDRLNGEVDTSQLQRKAAIYENSDPSTWPTLQELLGVEGEAPELNRESAASPAPGNGAPVAEHDTVQTTSGDVVTVNVTQNDTDPDGDVVRILNVGGAEHGSVHVDQDGRVVYTPDDGYTGTDTFTYTIEDGNGSSDWATVGVEVGPSELEARADSAQTAENEPVTIDVSANDLAPDGVSLSVTAVGDPEYGTASVTQAGNVEYTPDDGYIGADTFTYTARTGAGDTVEGTVSVDVEASPDTKVITGTEYRDTLDAQDKNTGYRIEGLGGPDIMTGSPYADTFVGGGHQDDMYGKAGDDTFRITSPDTNEIDGGSGYDVIRTAGDNNVIGLSSLENVEGIVGTNGDAVIRGGEWSDYLDFEGVAMNGVTMIDGGDGNDTLIGRDADDNIRGGAGYDDIYAGGGTDTVFYQGSIADYALEKNGDKVTITDNGGNGDAKDVVRNAEYYKFSDGVYTYADGAFRPVEEVENDAPKVDDGQATVAEDGSVTIDLSNLVSDPNGDALKIIEASADNGGVKVGDDGRIVYTPEADFNGDDTVNYTVADSEGAETNGEIAVSVTPVNDAPNLRDDEVVMNAGADKTITPLANDSDPEGDPLTVTNVADPAHGSITTNDDGSLVYQPDDGFTGQDTVTYTAADGQGGQAQASIEISVQNRAPTAKSESVTANPGEPVAIDVLDNDVDPDGHSLTVDAVRDPDHGTVSRDDAGELVYTPDRGSTGRDAFEYTVTDGHGGQDTATVNVTLRNIVEGTGYRDWLNQENADVAAVMHGNGGHDGLAGSAHDDVLVGGPGADDLYGRGGDDVFEITDGRSPFEDEVYGGAGFDKIVGNTENNDLHLRTISGVEMIDGRGGTNHVIGSPSRDGFDLQGVDVLNIDSWKLGDGPDIFTGSAGGDTVLGGSREDHLNGGAGSDTLVGGPGDDTLTGGDGADMFAVNTFGGTDVINDFDASEGDRLISWGDQGLKADDYEVESTDGDTVIDVLNGGQTRLSNVSEFDDGMMIG